MRPVFGFRVSIMCRIKAESPLVLGGTPRRKRLNLSYSASSWPHLSRLNGGLAVTMSNSIKSPFLSSSLGLRMVSPHSILWLSSPCRNMFILASDQRSEEHTSELQSRGHLV